MRGAPEVHAEGSPAPWWHLPAELRAAQGSHAALPCNALPWFGVKVSLLCEEKGKKKYLHPRMKCMYL